MRHENLKYMTDLENLVMDGLSVTRQMIVFRGRLLKNSLNRKFHLQQIWSQNHGRDCLQAFAHSNLNWLCCSGEVWADALFGKGICCFAQESISNMHICICALFLLSEQWMIVRLSQAICTALCSVFSRNPSRKMMSYWSKKNAVSDLSLPKFTVTKH